MENAAGTAGLSWSETVEDLVDEGQIEKAISYLESVVSNLEKGESLRKETGESSSVARELSSAMQQLSKLYSRKGFSARAVETAERAAQFRNSGFPVKNCSILDDFSVGRWTDAPTYENDKRGVDERSSDVSNGAIHLESSADDWEATADHAPDEFLSPLYELKESKPAKKDEVSEKYKRRGRGPFIQGLYSDNQSLPEKHFDDKEDSPETLSEEMGRKILIHGANHVLVLSGLPLSTRTTDLERLLVNFKDQFLIRWVNESTSLAVFRTPADAAEACKNIQFPFSVRILTEKDELFSSIPPRDLEPPRQRPQTSARAAQRMIAHSMGIRLPSTFGSNELRKQETERRNRIVSRRNMKDDAWGDDSK